MPITFTQTGRVEDILNGLRELQQRDDLIEEQVRVCGKQAGKFGWGCGVSFLLCFLAILLPFIAILTVPAVVACLVGIIYWGVQRSKWAKQDMEDRRLALALQFFEVLGRDVPKKARCALEVNFDGYQNHGQLVEQQGGGWMNPVRTLKYADTWFTARGTLHDGNQFRIAVEQSVRRKEKRKRKYTKVNERIAEEVVLTLKISPESYPNHQKLAQMLTTGGMEGLRVTRAQVENGVARVVGETSLFVRNTGRAGAQTTTGDQHLATGDTLLRLFLYVYDKLQQCRAEQATR
jgi:hypothetical protein